MPKFIITIGKNEKHEVEAKDIAEASRKVLEWNDIVIAEDEIVTVQYSVPKNRPFLSGVTIAKNFFCYPHGLTEKQLQGTIEDFLNHLEASGLLIADDETGDAVSDGYIIENYFATFEGEEPKLWKNLLSNIQKSLNKWLRILRRKPQS